MRGAFFGVGLGSVVSSEFNCSGNESSLLECAQQRLQLPCSHSEDAGVICPTGVTSLCSNGDVRLMDGTNQYEGRVEVCLNGWWGTTCDDLWDGYDATVVCRQLGYTENGYAVAVSSARFGPGNGFIVLDDVQCNGSESSLLECRAQGLGEHNCFSFEDAGVYCPCA